MQIHELNKRPTQINEVDLIGPDSVFNVSKQVAKNPSALLSNPAMGTAKQAAHAQSAQQSAAKLARQGFKIGGASTQVSVDQQIQAVKSNSALQQQIKGLSSQWASQSAALKKAQQSTMTEASVAQFDPRELTDPKYATVLKALQAQGVDPTKQVELEKKLSAWKLEFDTWAKSKLGNLGVNVDALRRDPEVKKMLESALSKIATAAQSGNANLENEAVEEYFTAAIAANQVSRKNNPTDTVAASPSTVASSQQSDSELLKQYGYSTSSSQLSDLSTAMRRAANGGTVIRNTGNEALNALARLAGFKVAET